MKTLKIFLLVLLILAIIAGSMLLLSPSTSSGNNYVDKPTVEGDNNLSDGDNGEDNDSNEDNSSFTGYYSELLPNTYIAQPLSIEIGTLQEDGTVVYTLENKAIIHIPIIDFTCDFFAFTFNDTGNSFGSDSYGAPEAVFGVNCFTKEETTGSSQYVKLDSLYFSGGRKNDIDKYFVFEKPNFSPYTLTDIIIDIKVFGNFTNDSPITMDTAGVEWIKNNFTFYYGYFD